MGLTAPALYHSLTTGRAPCSALPVVNSLVLTSPSEALPGCPGRGSVIGGGLVSKLPIGVVTKAENPSIRGKNE
jgi:hypothetical protein